MSKVMFVMDKPESCEKCKLSRCLPAKGVGICGINREHFDDMTKVQDWCPMRDVPEKDNESYYPDEYQDGFAAGYNFCLDEILGMNEIPGGEE